MSRQGRTLASLVLDPLYDKIIEKEQALIRDYIATKDLVGINLADRLGQLRATIVRQLYFNHGLSHPEIAKMLGMKKRQVQLILGKNREFEILTGGIEDE